MKHYFIFVTFLSILSASNNLEKYEVDSTTFVKLKSKSLSCRISYDMGHFDSTDCLNFKNSKKVLIFCTIDKKVCKTHSEVLFFAITEEELSKQKKSKKPLFTGTKIFNFAGGSGTIETIQITEKGYTIIKMHGLYSSSTTFEGTYQDFLKKYNIYEKHKDIICTKETKDGMECTELFTND